jgi:hypothetical protein
MGYHAEQGGSPRDVTIRASGTASAADAMDIMRDLARNERCDSILSEAEIGSVAETTKQLFESEVNALAWLCEIDADGEDVSGV